MKPNDFVAFFGTQRVSAILRTPIAEAAAPAMEAALNGGFRVIEFTLTTPGALSLIERFAQREGIAVGAGTVLTRQDARSAVEAGATFLVSPVVDEAVIEAAHELDVAVMPGTHTPTEMLRAHRAGAQLQKLFPAPGLGPAYVKACLGPLPFLRIVPTNGVGREDAPDWLDAGAFALGFVAPLFDAADIEQGSYDRIEQRARQLVDAAGGTPATTLER